MLWGLPLRIYGEFWNICYRYIFTVRDIIFWCKPWKGTILLMTWSHTKGIYMRTIINMLLFWYFYNLFFSQREAVEGLFYVLCITAERQVDWTTDVSCLFTAETAQTLEKWQRWCYINNSSVNYMYKKTFYLK